MCEMLCLFIYISKISTKFPTIWWSIVYDDRVHAFHIRHTEWILSTFLIHFFMFYSWMFRLMSNISISFHAPQFPDATGYVGFANLPNQVHRKSVKKGFEFTLMVVGEWSFLMKTLWCFFFLGKIDLCSVISVFRGVGFGQIDTHKQPVSHWSLPWALHPWCCRYPP